MLFLNSDGMCEKKYDKRENIKQQKKKKKRKKKIRKEKETENTNGDECPKRIEI